MRRIISVSVMCSDLMHFGQDIDRLKANGVDWLHVDVMDAHFVPNLTFGPDAIRAMQAYTDLPLDIHVMVEDPDLMLGRIDLRPGDVYTAHVELDRDYSEISKAVRGKSAMFGLAVNPDTPIKALERHLGLFDTVTLMTVYPGYAGAKLVEGIMDKVGVARKWLDAHGCENVMISVDGSVSLERAVYMGGLGAQIFVGGTAGIYRKGMALEETIPAFRKAIDALD